MERYYINTLQSLGINEGRVCVEYNGVEGDGITLFPCEESRTSLNFLG